MEPSRLNLSRGLPVGKLASTEQRLVDTLTRFQQGAPWVRGSAVADREGLPIANGFREPFDLIAMTAMATLAMQSSKTVFDRLGLEVPSAVTIEGSRGKVVVLQLAGGEASFIALVDPEANIGLLKLEMSVAARRLEEELGFALAAGGRAEEIFLLTQSGVLLAHASRSEELRDPDLVSSTFGTIQSLTKEMLAEPEGGAIDEMEMGHVRIRVFRGSWCMMAVAVSGTIGQSFEDEARDALREFEERNSRALDAWDGTMNRFEGAQALLLKLLQRPTG